MQRNRLNLVSKFNESNRKFTMGEIWSKRKNPISIISVCFQPLLTTQKVLSRSITPHLGLAQRWFFKEKMPFGIFELWQRKNRPLKNTHPESITVFKSPVEDKKNGDTSELQLGLAVYDVTLSKSHQICHSVGFKGKPLHRAPYFLNNTRPQPPAKHSREKLARVSGESHVIQKKFYFRRNSLFIS